MRNSNTFEMTSDLECPPSILSADEMFALDQIARELGRTDLTDTRRSELLHAIAVIAEKYTCDPRLADN